LNHRVYRQFVGFATVVLALGFSSCVTHPGSMTLGPKAPQPKSTLPIDPIAALAAQPFEGHRVQLRPVENLDAIVRLFGEPIEAVRKEIANKHEKGVIDVGVTLTYPDFVLRYYFVSSKSLYFPYSLTFTSNKQINRLAPLVGLAREELLSRISPREADFSTSEQLNFSLSDGVNQIAIQFDENDRVSEVRIDFYLD